MRLLLIPLVIWMLPAFAGDEPIVPDVPVVSIGWSDWMSSSALDEQREAGLDQLLYPDEVEGRIHDGVVQYRASFQAYPPDMNYYYTYWGMSQGWFDKYNEELAEQGYRLHTHTTFLNQAGAEMHQATWLMFGDVPEQPAASEMLWAMLLLDGERLMELLVVIAVIIAILLRLLLMRRREAQLAEEAMEEPEVQQDSTTGIDPVKW